MIRTVSDVRDFDPALAIGTADEFIAKPLPASRHHTRRGEPKAFQAQKQDSRFRSTDGDHEWCASESELLTATDRALRVRTAAAFDSVCSLLGRPSRKEFAPLAAFAARRALAALREGR